MYFFHTHTHTHTQPTHLLTLSLSLQRLRLFPYCFSEFYLHFSRLPLIGIKNPVQRINEWVSEWVWVTERKEIEEKNCLLMRDGSREREWVGENGFLIISSHVIIGFLPASHLTVDSNNYQPLSLSRSLSVNAIPLLLLHKTTLNQPIAWKTLTFSWGQFTRHGREGLGRERGKREQIGSFGIYFKLKKMPWMLNVAIECQQIALKDGFPIWRGWRGRYDVVCHLIPSFQTSGQGRNHDSRV